MDINENKIQYRETWTAQNISYNKKDSSWCGGGRFTSVGDCFKYGRLYMWEAAKTACPKGWHLPSRDEWNALIEAVGGTKVAGVNLKSTSCGGKDLYGFTALTAGTVGSDGDFGTSFNGVYFWSSTGEYFEQVVDGVAKTVVVNAYGFYSIWDNMEEVKLHKANAQSVRCILDKDSK